MTRREILKLSSGILLPMTVPTYAIDLFPINLTFQEQYNKRHAQLLSKLNARRIGNAPLDTIRNIQRSLLYGGTRGLPSGGLWYYD